MAMFEGMPERSRQTIAAKLLNTWNVISKRQDVNGFVSSRYPNKYNDIEKKFAIIKKITDIGGSDYIFLHLKLHLCHLKLLKMQTK